MRYTDLAERSRSHHYQHTPHFGGQDFHPHRQAFHNPHTSRGAAGHFLHIGMVAAPLVIGEMIHDPDKKWRAMRVVPVAGAVASEVLWTMKIAHDRKREQEDHAALAACHDQCR
jgi:hypothetical protein